MMYILSSQLSAVSRESTVSHFQVFYFDHHIIFYYNMSGGKLCLRQSFGINLGQSISSHGGINIFPNKIYCLLHE